MGTAWVSRHVAEATSLADAIARAADPRVSTALSYNLGDTQNRTMVNVEVRGLESVANPFRPVSI